MRKRTVGVVLIAVIAAYGLWQYFKPYPSQIKLTEQEHIVVNKLQENSTPRCIGWYQIDLPESFSMPTGLVFINKQKVETQRMYLPAFEQRIRLREEELRKTQTINSEDAPFLKQVYYLSDGIKGVIFERASSGISPDVFRNLEAHIYNNGVAFKMIIDTVNADGERYQKERNRDPDVYRNDVDYKLSELKNLLSRLHGRQENDAPKGPGVCIPDGFISGSTKGEDEVNFSYQSTTNPRLYLDFESNNFLQEDSSMLERSSSINNAFSENKIKTLMKGHRIINTLAAEEWLMVGNGEDVTSGHVFTLNVNEKSGSSATPYIRMELSHGPLPDKTLSENEIIVFWQQITATLRLRPDAI